MNITVRDLLESGVHFGHQTRRWNPKMKKYIFTSRNGIYIIDLHKTILSIQRAVHKVKETVDNGGTVLMVGTKKQAKDVIREEAQRSGVFYVSERWLGGMLTNFQTIKQSIRKLKEIDKMSADGTYDMITKKEALRLNKRGEKLKKVLGGIIDMYKLPDLLYVVDAKKEKIAVAEAKKLGIPVVAIIDTNTDPDPIDYPIAANDDAIKSISIITKEIGDAIIEGKHKASPEEFELQDAGLKSEPTAGASSKIGGDEKIDKE
ncbi:MAG: 30S ribosomal protein S2 [candidate division Zixibacteria bacterium CG_4_9_14_3_um_filter_46_8]|nr:MAG: 30S ribosomal protein S2 [candidate division Zixibacteria bacterium CG_4_9_14_3_um_filter_46_8]